MNEFLEQSKARNPHIVDIIFPKVIIPACNDNADAWMVGKNFHVAIHGVIHVFDDCLAAKRFVDNYFLLIGPHIGRKQ